MKRIVIAAIAAIGIAATPTATASAVPAGPSNAALTVQQLQAAGGHVILNKTCDEPLSQCRVLSVRSGRPVTETVPAGGGDTMQKVVYIPVYVDVDC